MAPRIRKVRQLDIMCPCSLTRGMEPESDPISGSSCQFVENLEGGGHVGCIIGKQIGRVWTVGNSGFEGRSISTDKQWGAEGDRRET